MTRRTLICDTEIYRNYFLAAFLDVDTGAVQTFERHDDSFIDVVGLRNVLMQNTIVTFNGTHFDLPLLSMATRDATNAMLKETCDKIIQNNLSAWKLGVKVLEVDHIDLIEVAPGVASLKIYGGRLNCQTMQDLPIEPGANIDEVDALEIRDYCVNDLQTTLALYRKLQPQIELRQKMSAKYGIDLRSKSDAQIAETVIRSEFKRLTGNDLGKPKDLAGKTFKYKTPEFIRFSSRTLADVLTKVEVAEFSVASNGAVSMPKELDGFEVRIGEGVYRMGIGGLHSSEKSIAHHADERTVLIDRDVASYYPSIILRCGLFPASMGRTFLDIYRGIVADRLAAKRAKDTVTADSLKIVVNGSFGKFGSKYSILYSPELLIQTTVTGQLALLMLIEMLEFEECIEVVSANTDGIVIKCPTDKLALLDAVVWEWEARTGFDTEETHYRALFSRDVNNYLAIKTDGKVKGKGTFAPTTLAKNPQSPICTEAVVRYLVDGTPVETTVRACSDVAQFVTVRQVKGGAIDQGGKYLGKAVRWYYSTDVDGPLRYKINNYTVAGSDGGRALMTMPDHRPDDINLPRYIQASNDILKEIGA